MPFTAGPRERQEHISLARLDIVGQRRKVWRREETIRLSGTDENTARAPFPPFHQAIVSVAIAFHRASVLLTSPLTAFLSWHCRVPLTVHKMRMRYPLCSNRALCVAQVMKLEMEKEARAKRILMRRINQEQEELVYRLRADGAQKAIARCWNDYKTKKEEQVQGLTTRLHCA